MGSSIDSTIYDAMRSHFDNFFLSLQGGGTTLNSFVSRLSSFKDTIETHRHNLQEKTLIAVRDFNLDIYSLATNILELETTSNKIASQIEDDVTRILDAEMVKLSISDKPNHITPEKHAKSPAYIQPSYKWLLANLHNPYPSKEIKKSISQQSRCSVKDIDAWFIDVRKRIGWNRIRKTRFSNKQEKIVAGASHVFKPKPSCFSDDLSTTLISEMDPNDAYRSEFIVMANDARSLYADKFPDLASSMSYGFDIVTAPKAVPKTLPELNITQSATFSSSIHHRDSVNSYPTPEPSPPNYHADESSTSLPTLVTPVSQSQSRKRRQSSSDCSNCDTEDISSRPSKKIRFDANQITDTSAVASLPSPSYTTDLSDDTLENRPSTPLSPIDSSAIASIPSPFDTTGSSDDTLEISPIPSHFIAEHPIIPEVSSLKRKRRPSNGERRAPAKHPHISMALEVVVSEIPIASEVSRLKRKRRLSDGESQCPPKRPHNALAQPRLQTVSDPFPMTRTSFPDLFETLTHDDGVSELDLSDIPSPATLQNPLSLTAPLDIFHGQYNISAAYLDTCPEISFAHLATEEYSATASSSESSKPFPDFVGHPYYPEYSQNSVFDVAVGTVALPVFDFTSASAYDLSLTTFSDDSQQSLPTSEWTAYLQSDHSYTSLQSLTPTSITTAKRDDTTPRALPDPNSSDAKRAKIQALNEQIRLLEAEL